MGFHRVGFSPMLADPNGRGQMQSDFLDEVLRQRIDCGAEF